MLCCRSSALQLLFVLYVTCTAVQAGWPRGVAGRRFLIAYVLYIGWRGVRASVCICQRGMLGHLLACHVCQCCGSCPHVLHCNCRSCI